MDTETREKLEIIRESLERAYHDPDFCVDCGSSREDYENFRTAVMKSGIDFNGLCWNLKQLSPEYSIIDRQFTCMTPNRLLWDIRGILENEELPPQEDTEEGQNLREFMLDHLVFDFLYPYRTLEGELFLMVLPKTRLTHTQITDLLHQIEKNRRNRHDFGAQYAASRVYEWLQQQLPKL